MLAAVAAARPDVVVHTAYRLDDPSVNVEGTRAVAAAAVAAGARLVHLSSDVVFPGTGTRALTEDDEPAPGHALRRVQARGRAPVPARRAARAHLAHLRRRRSPAPQERIALEVADGVRDMAFFTDESRCPIAVPTSPPRCSSWRSSDVAGPLHVAGADALTRLEFARLVCARHGRDPAALRGGAGGPDRPKHLVLDCSRARALLRVRLRGAREVLAA